MKGRARRTLAHIVYNLAHDFMPAARRRARQASRPVGGFFMSPRIAAYDC